MSGVFKYFWLPFVAASLLLVGCGVPIAPEAITATAVAQQNFAPATAPLASTGGSVSNDTALGLPSTSAGVEAVAGENPQPIPTLALAEAPTATPEPSDAPATTDAESTPEADEATVEPTPVDTPEDATVETTETPAEAPTSIATVEPTATPVPEVAAVNANFPAEFLSLLNAQRTGRGLGALTLISTMSGEATAYAGYMGTVDFFGHYGPDGSSPPSRLEASGYGGAYNGEALSAGQPTPQIALNALLASAPHAAILLDPKSTEVGIGYAYVQDSHYHHYWVVVTGF